MKKRSELALLAVLAAGCVHAAWAQQSTASGWQKSVSGFFSGTKEEQLVEPDQAFRLKVSVRGPDTLVAELAPAAGYYIYKSKIHFTLRDAGGAAIATVRLPAGEMKTDQIYGKTEVYRKPVTIEIGLRRPASAKRLTLAASYQGCQEKLGVCYPPVDKTFNLALP